MTDWRFLHSRRQQPAALKLLEGWKRGFFAGRRVRQLCQQARLHKRGLRHALWNDAGEARGADGHQMQRFHGHQFLDAVCNKKPPELDKPAAGRHQVL